MSNRDRLMPSRRTNRKRSRSISRSPHNSMVRSRSRSYSPYGRHYPPPLPPMPLPTSTQSRSNYNRRRAETEDGNPHYSNYYRDRFGSESPQEYLNLRITNIDSKVSNDELRDVLEKYLGRYGDMNVKIIRQMDPHERIAYVNFERIGDARNARHGCLHKLVAILGRRVTVDPAAVIRDQEGRFIKNSGGRSPPPPTRDAYERERSYRATEDRERVYKSDHVDNYRYHSSSRVMVEQPPRSEHRESRTSDKQGHSRRSTTEFGMVRGEWQPPHVGNDSDEESTATRTLFVGSLKPEVMKSDLQSVFTKYGVIEQIDIKTPHDGQSAYAFVRFQNMAMAQEAKRCLQGNCGSWKIGYGKPTQSRRLWVGGVGPNASLAWLEKEFDRFGAIEKIDYVRGENHAYVLFASEEASTEAWKKMKGAKLNDGNEKYLLQVDFADSSMYDNNVEDGGARGKSNAVDDVKQTESGGSGNKIASRSTGKRPTTPPGSPPPKYKEPRVDQKIGRNSAANPVAIISDGTVSSTTSPPLCELSAQTLEELHQVRSPCWTGALVLKKSAYAIRLYKLSGDDDLIDAYLRNENGESVQLTVTQRLKLDQPKQDDIRKWLSSPSDQHAFLLATANTNVSAAQGNLADLQPRPLKLLVKYFKEKDAAGVVSVTSNRRGLRTQQQNGILYTFPHCKFADLLAAALCPKLGVIQRCADDCLLVVLQKGGV